MGITKKKFVEALNAMEEQYRHDEAHMRAVSELFGMGDNSPYNNKPLVDSIISMLASEFSDEERAYDAILCFMYDHDFGKVQGIELDTPEKLYDFLVAEVEDKQSLKKRSKELPSNLLDLESIEKIDKTIRPFIETHVLIEDKISHLKRNGVSQKEIDLLNIMQENNMVLMKNILFDNEPREDKTKSLWNKATIYTLLRDYKASVKYQDESSAIEILSNKYKVEFKN